MTLTVCIGASGSGKTTFMEDVFKVHRCIYIRQYHNVRPYIVVSKIPNFDPTRLPFWEQYENEGKADKIKAGGLLGAKSTKGLSGGQRKLLLFELICQRTVNQRDLLILLDEPFSGVTDNFIPFIEKRLGELREKHNILLVTNDHVEKLTSLADNIIEVTAINRSMVKINDRDNVDRELAIMALSLGESFEHLRTQDVYKFFFDVEVLSSGDLRQIAMFAAFSLTLFIGTFWNSENASAPLIALAGGIAAFFNIRPYLIGLVEWRNSILEEAEALVHSSKNINRILKVLLTLSMVLILSILEFIVVNAVTNGLFLEFKYWLAMLCDMSSLALPFVCLGLFTRLPFSSVSILGSSPFLLMMFFSTAFSPGAGVRGLNDLRYLFPRFYYWCILPGSGPGSVSSRMQGCPANNLIYLYLILTAFVGVFIFFCFLGFYHLYTVASLRKHKQKQAQRIDQDYLREVQVELYGENALRRFQHRDSSSSDTSKSPNVNADGSGSRYENADASDLPDSSKSPEKNGESPGNRKSREENV